MKKYRVLDLFCGAGGLSLGFNHAGFEIVGGIDFDEDAIRTHHRNFPDSFSICKDIKSIGNEDIGKLFKNIDVIIGGPPCQGFSNANMWQKGVEDDRNKLFFEFIRFVEVIMPKVVLIENVPGILTKNNSYAKMKIYEILDKLGYCVDSSVLMASDFGVPQIRKRAFFIGVKKEVYTKFSFDNLRFKPKVSVKEAIEDLYNIDNETSFNEEATSDYQRKMREKSGDFIFNHEVNYPNLKVQERMKHVPQGGNWRNVPENLWDSKRDNRHSSAYKRISESNQSITIDTGHMNYFHPKYNRVPTVRESARLQSFSDDFIFLGSKTSQFRQVGNAVPPLLAQAIAEELYRLLEGNNE